MNFLLKQEQSEGFSEDIGTLKAGRELSKKSKILSLAPFLDDQSEVIREVK